MFQRKSGEKISNKNQYSDEKYDQYGIPYEIYGPGYGLEDIQNLLNKFNKQIIKNAQDNHDEWEEIVDEDSKKKDKDNLDDDEIEIDDEDVLEIFIMENTKSLNSGSFTCKICNDKKKISPMNVDIHFSKKHKEEYEKSEYAKDGKKYSFKYIKWLLLRVENRIFKWLNWLNKKWVIIIIKFLVPWKEAIKIHEKKLAEGPDFENFDDIAASMFGDPFGGKSTNGKKNKNMFDMESLMFEMMGGMGGMGSMGGIGFDDIFGGPTGSKKKKSKKK